MNDAATNYRQEFLRSSQHVVMALLTLGVGFLSGDVLGLIAGSTAYVLGWIYVPDMAFFRRQVDQRGQEARRAAELARLTAFQQRREYLLKSLSAPRRQRYANLVVVCRGIETSGFEASGGEVDPRVRKLDELMWTFLRLLTIEESLERFLDTESQEKLPDTIRTADEEIARIKREVEALQPQGGAALETRQRLLGSRVERLDVLRKRLERLEQARQNRDLVVSEQERLEQQIKLIRADAAASRNAAALTERIDATVAHLDQTNKWLSEMDEFKDVVSDLPALEARVGFDIPQTAATEQAEAPPPLPRRVRIKAPDA